MLILNELRQKLSDPPKPDAKGRYIPKTIILSLEAYQNLRLEYLEFGEFNTIFGLPIVIGTPRNRIAIGWELIPFNIQTYAHYIYQKNNNIFDKLDIHYPISQDDV